VEVRLLGELEAVHGGTVVEVRGRKQRALLAMLALRRGGTVSSDQLIDVLWGDSPPTNAPNTLQAQVAQLRRTLPPGVVETRPGGYGLAPAVDVDVAALEEAVGAARADLAAGAASKAAGRLRAALAVVRGEALVDFAFDDFAAAERARLGELVADAMELRIEADLASGRHAECIGELEALCLQHPLRERVWALRMLALYRSGRQADALRSYDEARAQLVEQLGIEPGPELQRLRDRVLQQDASLLLVAPPAVRRSAAVTNLRRPLTNFVGRDRERELVLDTLGSARLVTITGPGGAGKSRLAAETCRAVHEAGRDVFLVELAAVVEGEAIEAAIAAAVCSEDRGWRTDAEGPADAVRTRLGGRSALVVLDNCEHVVDSVAAVAAGLLEDVPDLWILATSREALAVPGEHVVTVGPLAEEDAAALFVDRARAARRDLSLDTAADGPVVLDICRRLDCLPLALELAAARLRTLPLRQLAARLDDRFRILTGGARTALPRQQTLRAVVDWSYDLLFGDEQVLFTRLGVFSGGFTLEAAEEVCADDDVRRELVVELVLRLVDKSLVVPSSDGQRFGQLQTILHYARERLAATEESELRRRHAAHYLRFALDARQRLRSANALEAHADIAVESDNLELALRWFAEEQDRTSATALTSALCWHWFTRAEYTVALRWLSVALAVPGDTPPAVAAIALAWRGYFTAIAESHARGTEETAEAVALAERCGDDLAFGEALLLHASTLLRARRVTEGVTATRRGVDVLEGAGNAWGQAIGQLILALASANAGHLDDARRAASEAVARFEALGMPWALIEPFGILASVADAQGDEAEAESGYEEALKRARVHRADAYVADYLIRLGALRARRGDDAGAASVYAEALDASRSPNLSGFALVGRSGCLRRLGDTEEAQRLLHEARRLFDQLGHRGGAAIVLVATAWSLLSRGQDAVGIADEAVATAQDAGDGPAARAARTVALAARACAEPSPERVAAFLADADDRRVRRAPHVGAMDEPDIAALSARFASLAPA
jgi:predicted ATPase/DNA-binding SARP family transcriptional activator